MQKIFYLMHYGQTLFNAQGRIQGACDSPLTALGIKQAQAARAHFQEEDIIFDKVYSSTQERACDTAEIASGRTDLIRLKGLKEWNFGAFEGHQEYLNPHLFKEDGSGYRDYFVAYGGESNVEVYQRMAATIKKALADKKEEERSLFVSHGASITQFYRHMTVEAPILTKGMSNCAILKLAYDGTKMRVLSVYNPMDKEYIFDR
ncbi:phosphoglycerate mutase family protein [Streptococcus pseudoporcinus]|uniref:Phosphoglycerate mutase family protein n=1 Tax=Streptococcus pseudoporcinus TaxID=361101 RepID=A0A4U9YLA5_9STRE|nr:histidine phosphatase family protein [Streptococcus pseudoporcinus]VTS26461.1 phosphoglycerate mutase family protein [Streptococcus pseudoporcinus]